MMIIQSMLRHIYYYAVVRYSSSDVTSRAL